MSDKQNLVLDSINPITLNIEEKKEALALSKYQISKVLKKEKAELICAMAIVHKKGLELYETDAVMGDVSKLFISWANGDNDLTTIRRMYNRLGGFKRKVSANVDMIVEMVFYNGRAKKINPFAGWAFCYEDAYIRPLPEMKPTVLIEYSTLVGFMDIDKRNEDYFESDANTFEIELDLSPGMLSKRNGLAELVIEYNDLYKKLITCTSKIDALPDTLRNLEMELAAQQMASTERGAKVLNHANSIVASVIGEESVLLKLEK